MWIALYILSVLCPIVFIEYVVDEFLTPKMVVYVIGSLVVIGLSFFRKNQSHRYENKWIGFIFIYLCLYFGYIFFVPIAFQIQKGRMIIDAGSFIPYLNVIIGIFLMKVLIEGTDYLKRWVILSKVLCYLSFAFSIYTIMQYFGLDQIFSEKNGWYVKSVPDNNVYLNSRIISFLGNDFFTANFLAILSPLMLIFKQLRYKIFYASTIIAMYFLNSTISIGAMAVSLIVFLLITKKWKALVVSILLLSVFTGYKFYKDKNFFSSSGRIHFWEIAIKEWKKMPITGYGLGSFERAKYMVGNDRFGLVHLSRVHNDYIQILYEGGLVLLGLVMIFIYDLFKRLIFIKPTVLSVGYMCGFLAFLIIAFAGFPMEVAPLALLGILYISSLESQIRGDEYVG